MTTEELTIETLASAAASFFEGRTRGEGSDAEEFRALKDGRPDWVQELVYEAHGDFGPDDWRYSCIEDALQAIADGTEDSEFADSAVDVYNGARAAWLATNLNRGGYCDEAIDEFGPTDQGIYGLIGMGQYMEASEVYGLVKRALEVRVYPTAIDTGDTDQ